MTRRLTVVVVTVILAVFLAACGSTHPTTVVGAVQNSIPLSQKAAASGVASLNSSSLLVQELRAGSVTNAQLAGSITEGKLKNGTVGEEIEGKLVPTGGSAGECLARHVTVELEWKTCTGGLTIAEAEEKLAEASKAAGYPLLAQGTGTTKPKYKQLAAAGIESGAVEEAKLHNEAVTLGKIKAAGATAKYPLVVKTGGTELEWAKLPLGGFTNGTVKLPLVGGASEPEYHELEAGGIKAEAVTAPKLYREGEQKLLLPSAEEPKTVGSGTTSETLNLEAASNFILKDEHVGTLKIKLEHAIPGVSIVHIWYTTAASGAANKLEIEGIKWVGSAPTFEEGANKENLVTLIIKGAKASEPYGI